MIALKKLNTIIMLSLFGIAYGSTGKIKHGSHILYTDGGNNEIRCQTQALCDIALVKGDSFVNWIITDGKPWADSARKKTTYIDSDGKQHVILQATYAEASYSENAPMDINLTITYDNAIQLEAPGGTSSGIGLEVGRVVRPATAQGLTTG
jgi:hypothetical protein